MQNYQPSPLITRAIRFVAKLAEYQEVSKDAMMVLEIQIYTDAIEQGVFGFTDADLSAWLAAAIDTTRLAQLAAGAVDVVQRDV